MSSSNTQLSSPETYDVNRMIFSKAIKGAAKSTDGSEAAAIKFSRIMISTQNEDGSVGELVLPTTELFSFGVSMNVAQDGSGKVNGYSLPLCLWNKDNPLPIEKAFSNKLEEITERCKDHLLLDSTKDETEKYDLERTELKKLNSFIYWKKEKGKVVEGAGPTLYPKLIESKKANKIVTSFFDPEGNEIDPMNLIGKYCYVKAAIKIESIFIGAAIKIQVKVYEAEVRLVEMGTKRLLKRPAAESGFSKSDSMPLQRMDVDNENDNEDEENNNDDDDDKIEDTAQAAAPPKAVAPAVEAPARKQVRVVKKKV